MEEDRRLGTHPLGRRIGLERRYVDDAEVRREGLQIRRRRASEEVAGEDAGPRGFGGHPQRAPVVRMRTDVEVLAVDGPIGDVLQQARAEAVVVLLADRPVDGAPPDLVNAAGLLDQELVLRRAPGVLAGADDE